MLYNILVPFAQKFHIANLFTYISFRSGLAILVSISLSLYMGPKLIRYLRGMQKNGQPIRDDGPASHFSKAGTPTMGGLMILGSTIITTLLLADLSNPYIWVVLFVLLSFGYYSLNLLRSFYNPNQCLYHIYQLDLVLDQMLDYLHHD